MNDVTAAEPVAIDVIRSRIFTIRGVQVMLDRDLAELYGVTTGALNQAVKRNKQRFPQRFMFQLNKDEAENLKSRFVISSCGGVFVASEPILTSPTFPTSWRKYDPLPKADPKHHHEMW